jgi:3-isopropylmalate/(R)-2-methylmalate dehydratase small subunit
VNGVYNNGFQNGMLPVVLPAVTVAQLAGEAANGAPFTVDLVEQMILTQQGEAITFDIDAQRRQGLLEGLDDISLTLKRLPEIVAWQSHDRVSRPWIWNLRPS